MRSHSQPLLFSVSVWGAAYIKTFLELALPSFLSPGNIPACAKLIKVQFQVITRPEDAPTIKAHPSIAALSAYANVSVEPHLTPDCFAGNRYTIMALANRIPIAKSLESNAILSILPPDCIIADGTLSFGLHKILAGYQAVLVCGPKGVLEDIAPRLTSAPYKTNGAYIEVPPRDLVALRAQHPHPIAQIVYWRRNPFSGYPSSVFWEAGKELILARYFHLHPLFVNMSNADASSRNCGTLDGNLINLARISPEKTFVAVDSDDMCVIELSSRSFDPMACVPTQVDDKAKFILDWSRAGEADSVHREQFRKYTFKLKGREEVDWDAVIADADRDMKDLFAGLAEIDREEDEQRRRQAEADRRRVSLQSRTPMLARWVWRATSRFTRHPRKLVRTGWGRIRKKLGA